MISRGRARWAKTERAQWSRDHQTNNTVPTTRNGASCCAPFFFLCRSRFCRFFFFFFFPRPAVLLFHRSRPTATSLPPSSTRCRTRWIYDGFRRDFPGDSAESWTPSPPPKRGGSSRSHGPPLRPTLYIRTEEDLPSIHRWIRGNTTSSLAGNIIRGLLSRSIFGQTSFYPVSLFPRFHLYLSSIFHSNSSLDSSDRSRSLSIFNPLVYEIRFKVTYRSGSSVT